jgi:signal recognition particle GTPase
MVTKTYQLTEAQLNTLIDQRIDERLEELLNDPDRGLELREEIIQKLKAQKLSHKKRIPMEQVAKEFGFKLE